VGSKSLLALLWILGTGLAATVAWQSLRFVSASTEVIETASGQAAAGGTTSTSSVSDVATVSSGGRTVPGETSAGSELGIGVDTIQPPATSSTVAVDDTVVAPTADPAAGRDEGVEQIFDLTGGRTAVRFSPTGVSVAWATPAPGYRSEIHTEDGGLEIEFRGQGHRSKIELWWADGPRWEIEEEREDGD